LGEEGKCDAPCAGEPLSTNFGLGMTQAHDSFSGVVYFSFLGKIL
jgi:hypothetical protein